MTAGRPVFELTAQIGRGVNDRLFGLFQVGQDVDGTFVILSARSGQRLRARRALQELDTEFRLERPHPAADNGFRNIEAIGRFGETAGLHHGHQGLDICEFVHIVAKYRTVYIKGRCLSFYWVQPCFPPRAATGVAPKHKGDRQ